MAHENQMPQKRYIGDSVYASFDGEYIWLETDNGLGVSNRIALDAEVLAGFDRLRAEIGEWRVKTELSRPMSRGGFQREYLASPAPEIDLVIRASYYPHPEPLPMDGSEDASAGQRLREILDNEFMRCPMTVAILTEIASRAHFMVSAMAGGRIRSTMLVGYGVGPEKKISLFFYATHPSDEVLREMGLDVFTMDEQAQERLFQNTVNSTYQGLVNS